MVVDFIRQRIKNSDIVIPKCLASFVDRQLKVWTENAMLAEYAVTTDDSYKLDDLRDGLGQQLVIMDKETGVEQVSMHWSHGLHQFLQLKHSLKLSPISLKAVFMSNINYFNEFKGRLFGLTGTLGSLAECQLLNDVFGVQFLKMPRFKRRFCSELNAMLATTTQQWLENISLATITQLDGKIQAKRAVLIVCDNISAVDSIVKRLEMDGVGRIRAYKSSFDKEFQKEQQEKALEPGDVIVATNLAGRGTDLKINSQLEENGGLHVIISYVPANSRVEAQAQGRTARAGQPGTYQFIVQVEDEDSDWMAQLQRLKEERDEREAVRLEKLGTSGLETIKLEEKLFNRFRLEIYVPIEEKLKQQSPNDGNYVRLQLDFLTNKWALWLDENGTTNSGSNNFEGLRNNCLLLADSSSNDSMDLVKFASMPSELVKLATHFMTDDHKNLKAADWCLQLVVEREPEYCENALIHQTYRILQKENKIERKLEAKRLLSKVKLLIENKIRVLSSCAEIVNLVAKIRPRIQAKTSDSNKSRLDEQVHY